jgi:hypothetical protein
MSFKSNLATLQELSNYWISCDEADRFGVVSNDTIGIAKVVHLYALNNPLKTISGGTLKTIFTNMIDVGKKVVDELARFEVNVGIIEDLLGAVEEFLPQFLDEILRTYEKCLPQYFNVAKKQMSDRLIIDKREDYIRLLENCAFMAKTIEDSKNVSPKNVAVSGRILTVHEEEAQNDIEDIIQGNRKSKSKKQVRTYSSASSFSSSDENNEQNKRAKSTKSNVVTGSAKKKREKIEDVVKPSNLNTSELYFKTLIASDELIQEQSKNDRIDKMKIEKQAFDLQANKDLFDKLADSRYFTSTESYQTMTKYLGDLGIYDHTDMPTLKNLSTATPEDIQNTMKESLKAHFQRYCTSDK